MKYIVCVPIRWFNAEAYYGFCIASVLKRNGKNVEIHCRKNDPIIKFAKKENIKLKIFKNTFQWIFSNLKSSKNSTFIALNGNAHFIGFLIKFNLLKLIRIRAEIRKPSKNILNKFIYKFTDHIICGAEFIKRIHLKKWKLNNSSTIYCPVDTKLFKPSIKKNKKIQTIGIIARFDPVKGHEIAFKAIKNINNIKLKVYGYNANMNKNDILKLTEKYNVADKIEIFDKKQDISKILKEIDIGLITSQGSEANCRILLEFMSCGIPVVSTDAGIIPEIIHHGNNGFVVNKKKYDQLSFCIQQLVNSKELRNKIGNSALNTIKEKFSFEVFYDKLMKIIT